MSDEERELLLCMAQAIVRLMETIPDSAIPRLFRDSVETWHADLDALMDAIEVIDESPRQHDYRDSLSTPD